MNKNSISIFFLSSSTLIAWLLSYLYHPVMIRYLSIEDFWSFQSILSLMSILWVLSNSLWLFYVKEVSRKIDNTAYIKFYRNTTTRYIFYLWLSVSLLFLLALPYVSSYLNIPYYYFLPVQLTIIFSFLAMTNNAYLQSLKKFKSIALIITSMSFLKLLTWFIFVYFGFWVLWALWGLIISQIVTFIIWFFILQKYFLWIKTKDLDINNISKTFLTQKRQILQYLFTSILIALFMNIDILIVKNIFDGETAGYYAAISVLAKFLVFLGLSIETVYYPQLVKESILPKLQLLKVSWYYVVMTLWALVFFMIFGETILRLFKDGLQDYVSLVYPLIAYCGLLAYLSIVMKTLIAFEYYTVNYLLWVLIIGLVVCLYTLGNSLLWVTQIFAVFGLVWVVLGLSQLERR